MIESLYPGVFLTEIAFDAHPIDGVPTAPDWTAHNASDPGITLLQLLGWLGDSLVYGTVEPRSLASSGIGNAGSGVVGGLHIGAREPDANPAVHVTAGHAVGRDGRPLELQPAPSLHAWALIHRR